MWYTDYKCWSSYGWLCHSVAYTNLCIVHSNQQILNFQNNELRKQWNNFINECSVQLTGAALFCLWSSWLSHMMRVLNFWNANWFVSLCVIMSLPLLCMKRKPIRVNFLCEILTISSILFWPIIPIECRGLCPIYAKRNSRYIWNFTPSFSKPYPQLNESGKSMNMGRVKFIGLIVVICT